MLRTLVPSAAGADPPHASPASWLFFLHTERCALPLKARLVATGGHGGLAPAARRLLDTAAQVELQRVLSARAQLLLVDRLAAEHGWNVVVLKGGVAALAERGAVDLVDVDVLAEPDDARALAAALDDAGYPSIGFSSPFHLHAQATEGELPIEVHIGIDMSGTRWSEGVLNRAIPVPGAGHVRQLSPRDHLWHLLVHVGVRHPYRRSSVRDLLLIGQALARCSDGDVEEVMAAVGQHEYADALRNMLLVARGLAGEVVLQDRLASHAVAAYVVGWYGRRLPLFPLLKADVGKWAIALLSGWSEIKSEWKVIRMVTTGPSFARPIAWIERKAPRIGRGVRVASRLARVSIAIVFAVPLALAAAFVARRVMKAGT